MCAKNLLFPVMCLSVSYLTCPAFTLPKLLYKGAGPPRAHHIKKNGLLKKALVEVIEPATEAASSSSVSSSSSSSSASSSDFGLDLDFGRMYHTQPASRVAELLAEKQAAREQAAKEQTVKEQAAKRAVLQAAEKKHELAATRAVETETQCTTQIPLGPGESIIERRTSPDRIAASCESVWNERGVTCRLTCSSLTARGAPIAFCADEWDEVLPVALQLHVQLPQTVCQRRLHVFNMSICLCVSANWNCERSLYCLCNCSGAWLS